MLVEEYPDCVATADAVELDGFVCDACGKVYDTIGEALDCEVECSKRKM